MFPVSLASKAVDTDTSTTRYVMMSHRLEGSSTNISPILCSVGAPTVTPTERLRNGFRSLPPVGKKKVVAGPSHEEIVSPSQLESATHSGDGAPQSPSAQFIPRGIRVSSSPTNRTDMSLVSGRATIRSSFRSLLELPPNLSTPFGRRPLQQSIQTDIANESSDGKGALGRTKQQDNGAGTRLDGGRSGLYYLPETNEDRRSIHSNQTLPPPYSETS